MKRLLIFLLGALLPLTAVGAGAADVVEGKQYVRLKVAQPVETGSKIEVIQFFSYGCPHCNDLEPFLDAWVKKLPPDVQFRRVPVMFQERWVALAKVYYTLVAMGEEERLSPEVFKAIHGAGAPLYQEKAFFDWAATKGLDRTKVAEIYASFAVNSKINRAKSLAQMYNVQAVPEFVIDGKYLTSTDRVGSHAAIPGALDAIVAKARAERPKG